MRPFRPKPTLAFLKASPRSPTPSTCLKTILHHFSSFKFLKMLYVFKNPDNLQILQPIVGHAHPKRFLRKEEQLKDLVDTARSTLGPHRSTACLQIEIFAFSCLLRLLEAFNLESRARTEYKMIAPFSIWSRLPANHPCSFFLGFPSQKFPNSHTCQEYCAQTAERQARPAFEGKGQSGSESCSSQA